MKLLNLYNEYLKANTSLLNDLPRPTLVVVTGKTVWIDDQTYVILIDPDLFLDCLSEIMTGFEISSIKDWDDAIPPLYKVTEYDIPKHIEAELRNVQSKEKSNEDC